jgi:phosphoglycolate phosphatase-like HAD superfamily hydrolase
MVRERMEQRWTGVPSVTDRVAKLRSILRNAELTLLDFDGPLCDVFAGLPAEEVARQLETIAGVSFATDDPLDILERAANLPSDLTSTIEDELIAAEVRAVACSSPTVEGVAFLRLCVSHGKRVGIVSNNSANAVYAFLEELGLSGAVAPVVGRAFRHPELMKPNPWPIRTALATAAVPARSAVYVGDSMSDIEVAQAVSMACVAYANKPGKRERFEVTSAVVIDSMSELTDALSA